MIQTYCLSIFLIFDNKKDKFTTLILNMIAQNLQRLRKRIAEICEDSERDPKSVKLIAVSKSFSVEDIKTAIQEGQNDFGENKAQELVAKFEVLGNRVSWHFLGHLQRNKVKYAVRTADYIHSVDSRLLVEEIQKHAHKLGKIQKILIQVKTSEEETKSGVISKDELRRILDCCINSANIKLIGLMTISPLTDNKDLIRKSFGYLRNLKDKLNSEGYNLSELSMGMTNDFEIAIREGATMLRIGSAIFGERIYHKN